MRQNNILSNLSFKTSQQFVILQDYYDFYLQDKELIQQNEQYTETVIKYLKIFILHQIKQYDENCTYILDFLDYISINDNTGIINNILQYALKYKKAFKMFQQKDRLDIFLRGLMINGKCDIFGQMLKNIKNSQLKQYYNSDAYMLIYQYKDQVSDLLLSFKSHIFNCNQYYDKDIQIQKISYFSEKNQEYRKNNNVEKKQKKQAETPQKQTQQNIVEKQQVKQEQNQQEQQIEKENIQKELLLSDILQNDDKQVAKLQSTQSQIQSSVLLDQSIKTTTNNQQYINRQVTQNFESILYLKIQYQQQYLSYKTQIQGQIQLNNLIQQLLSSIIIQEQNINLSIPLDQYLYVYEGQQYLVPMTKNISYNELKELLDDKKYHRGDDYKCAVCNESLSIYKQLSLPNQILQSDFYIKDHVCEKCYNFYSRLYQLPCMLTVLSPNMITDDLNFRKMLYLSKKIILFQKLSGIHFQNLNQEDNEIIINNQKLQLNWESKHLITLEDIRFAISQRTGNITIINDPYISFNDICNSLKQIEQLQNLLNQLYKIFSQQCEYISSEMCISNDEFNISNIMDASSIITPIIQNDIQLSNKQSQVIKKQQFLCCCGKSLNILDNNTYICFNCGCIQHYNCKEQKSKDKCFVCKDFKL